MVDSPVHGVVAPGFEPVRDAFRDNLLRRGEQGAAFAAVRDGVAIVDLWGGAVDDAGTPWREDTLQLVFSGTKGLVALCLLMLADRGQLDLDAPAAAFWPELAAHGKERVTVAELASHQGRLPRIRAAVDHTDLVDDRRMAALLADQPQDDDPRAGATYHAFTYGWLCGEVIRRVAGRSVGRFSAEEVAGPLGLELWIGLPPELEHRVSTLRYAPSWDADGRWAAAADADDALWAGVWRNPTIFPAGGIPWNRPDWHRAEIPGAGAIGTARAIGRLYGCLARGGAQDGVRLLSEETLAAGVSERTRRHEPLLDEPTAFGVGFSYAMNTLRGDELVDPRAQALLLALHACLEADGG